MADSDIAAPDKLSTAAKNLFHPPTRLSLIAECRCALMLVAKIAAQALGLRSKTLLRLLRQTIRKDKVRQLLERIQIDLALKKDNIFNRLPIVHPAPVIELRLRRMIQANIVFRPDQPEHEPTLLLPDTRGRGVSPAQPMRQPVTQPMSGASHDFHMMGFQPRLFPKLAVERVNDRLVFVDAALRELPSVLTNPTRPEHLAIVVTHDDADVGTISVRIDH